MRHPARRRALLDALRAQPDGATAEGIALGLGVSARTIYRDLERLRAEGAPIEAGRGPGGGYRWSEREARVLLSLAALDARWLLGLLDAVLDARWLPFREATERIRDDLRAGLASVVVSALGPGPIQATPGEPEADETFAVLLEHALRDGTPVRIRARRGRGFVERVVTPTALVKTRDAIHLRARDAEGHEADVDLDHLVAVEPVIRDA